MSIAAALPVAVWTISVWAMGVWAIGLGGCAAHHINRPDWSRLGNTSTAEGGPAYHRDPHHQYFDKSHNRYYYYDMTRKQFFWENGQPKG